MTKRSLYTSWVCLLTVLLTAAGSSAITLQVSPGSTATDSSTDIVLTASGVGAGEKIKFERLVDVNGNGSVDAEDFVIESFFVTDNQSALIGGVSNSAVPGDSNPNTGAIQVHISFQAGTEVQRTSGKFIFRATGSAGSALANFSVTQPSSTEKIQGKVLSGGIGVGGTVLAVLVQAGDDMRFITGALTAPDGTYSVNLTPGSYQLIALKPGYFGDFSQAAAVTLTTGQTANADVTIQAASGPTISGSITDASSGLPVLSSGQLFLMSDNGKYGVTLVKSDSTYSFQGPADHWGIDLGRADLLQAGYVDAGSDRIQLDTTTGNASFDIKLQKATALFYGTIKNAQTGVPFNVPIQIYGQDQSSGYRTEPTSASDGTYSAGVVPGSWYLSINSRDNPALNGYVVSQGGPYAIAAGQAVKVDFFMVPATHSISGILKDSNNNPLSGIDVFANTLISNQTFQVQSTTDSQGHFTFGVINAQWNVWADSDGLGQLGLQPPPNQSVNVSGADTTVTLVAGIATAHIQGRVVDENGVPITSVRVIASNQSNFSSSGSDTDGSGFYNIGVSAGMWYVQLETTSAGEFGVVSSSTIVTVIDGETKSNINIVARHANFRINGILKADTGEPLANVQINASISINSVDYYANGQTLPDGSFSMRVFNGTWNISMQDLGSFGLETPQTTPVVVNNADASVTIIAKHLTPPSLSNLRRMPGGEVQFHINDTSMSQPIRIYATSDFKTWDTLGPIYSNGSGFDYMDNNASQYTRRFYKVVRE